MQVNSKPNVLVAPSMNTVGVDQLRVGSAGQAQSTSTTAQISVQASQVFTTKSEVGTDLERLQQSMKAPIEQLNDMFKGSGRSLAIGIDPALNGPVVMVKNIDTGEVIRQIPTEVVVRLAHSIEAFKGLLHDQKA